MLGVDKETKDLLDSFNKMQKSRLKKQEESSLNEDKVKFSIGSSNHESNSDSSVEGEVLSYIKISFG